MCSASELDVPKIGVSELLAVRTADRRETTSSLRWIRDPRSHAPEKLIGRTLVLLGFLDHISDSSYMASTKLALRSGVGPNVDVKCGSTIVVVGSGASLCKTHPGWACVRRRRLIYS